MFYTYEQAADKLGISESSLRKKVADGLIPCHRLTAGRLVRFTDEDLLAAFTPVPAATNAPTRRRRRHRPIPSVTNQSGSRAADA
jgi:excisionase family DNA binding protein